MSFDRMDEFGQPFQHKLFKYLMVNREFADKIIDILEPKYFSNEHYARFCRITMDYREEFKRVPSVEIMESLVQTVPELSEPKREMLKTIMIKVKDANYEDQDFVEGRSLEFCKNQAVKNALVESVTLLKNKKYDDIREILDKALKAGEGSDLGHDYFNGMVERMSDSRVPIPTGINEIDLLTRGGLDRSELGVVMCALGGGKSTILAIIGANALRNGKTVAHITLELSPQQIGLKYDAALLNVAIDEVLSEKETSVAQLKKIHSLLRNPKPKLFIKEFAADTVYISRVRSYINQMRARNVFPDVLLIDYADLLLPPRKSGEFRHELRSIYVGLRSLGSELGIPIWTASQSNREGIDTEIIDLKMVGEALAKAQVADFWFCVGRTIKQKNDNLATMYVAKNRMGRDGLIYPLQFNTGTVSMKVCGGQMDIMDFIRSKESREKSEDLMRLQGVVAKLGEEKGT